MLPSYIVFMLLGIGLGLLTSKFPDKPSWNKAAMLCLVVAAGLIVYGFMIYNAGVTE